MSQSERIVSRRAIVGAGTAVAGFALTTPPALGQTGPGRATQAVIRTDLQVITLVTVFAVESVNLPKLLDVLREGTESFFSKMPGFVSSSVLTARDSRRVINYSQWRSPQDTAAFRQDPRFVPYIQRLRPLATLETFDCEVAYVKAI